MIEESFDNLVSRYPVLQECLPDVILTYRLILSSFQTRHKLLVCGNGGSAADSEHIAGELLKGFKFNRGLSDLEFIKTYKHLFATDVPLYLEDGFPVIPLTSQGAFTSAFSNDLTAVGVFAQQVYVYGQKDDVIMILSTSGNSLNCIEAAKVAKAKLMNVIALTGSKKSELYKIADVTIRVPKSSTPEIQELHLPIYHAICAAIEQRLCYAK